MNLECLDRCQGNNTSIARDKGPSRTIDNLGIFASSLCLIHCLAMPTLLAIVPTWTALHEHVVDDLTHIFLAGFVITFCLLGIVPGFRTHKRINVMVLMGVGLSIVLLATFHGLVGLDESMELPLITMGNLMVISSHFWNRKLLKSSV